MDEDATETGQQDQAESRESPQIDPPQLGASSRMDASPIAAAARAQRDVNWAPIAGVLTSVAEAARAQRDLNTASIATALTSVAEAARAQRDLNTASIATALTSFAEAAARTRERLGSGPIATLAEVAAQISVSQSALRDFQAAASQSWLREMQAVSPLLHRHFEQPMLNLIDTTLEGLASHDAGDEVALGNLSDETVHEIEEALSSFEQSVQGLPPAIARRLWITWVQLTVFALCLHLLILLPVAAEVMALMGYGALPLAQQAGLEAAKVWDKYHPRPDSDSSEEE